MNKFMADDSTTLLCTEAEAESTGMKNGTEEKNAPTAGENGDQGDWLGGLIHALKLYLGGG